MDMQKQPTDGRSVLIFGANRMVLSHQVLTTFLREKTCLKD